MANCGPLEHTRPRHARLLSAAILCLTGCALLSSSGCSGVLAPAAVLTGPANGMGQQLAYSNRVDSMVLNWRNKAWAHHAWHCRKHQFEGRGCFSHFGHGFCQGYRDVASGGNGCVPAVPPRAYWSWRYQTAEGQSKVAAWFDGYPAGALAAAEDGAANWGQIQVSPLIEAQYAQRGFGGPPGPGGSGAPAGPNGLPADELPPGPMGLPPLAPEVKKNAPVTPQSPRLTNELRPGVPPLSAPVAQVPPPAVYRAGYTDAAGNPLRETGVVNAAGSPPHNNVPNALRSPFEQVSVPIGLPPAGNASVVPSSYGAPATAMPSSR